MAETFARDEGALTEFSPDLAKVLRRNAILTPARYAVSAIRFETVRVPMRDGVRLATDLYLPPAARAPAILVRTPYGRAVDGYAGAFLSLARRGFIVASQDCRGTGDSEPDAWDYYLYEPEDGYDFVDWVARQPWFDGFLGSCGGSYLGQTQWQMAAHPAMTTIVPDMSGLGVATNTTRLHMFTNAYARSVGKGTHITAVPYFELEGQMLEETLAGGVFNAPLNQPIPEAVFQDLPVLRTQPPAEARQLLWEHYCSLSCEQRARFVKKAFNLSQVTSVDVESFSVLFGQDISHDRHTLPAVSVSEMATSLRAPVLLRTGWYDWGLNDALATWKLIAEEAPEPVRLSSRLFIAPCAHNTLGYHEGMAAYPELHHAYGVPSSVEMLARWYEATRTGATDSWPRVIYYLMGTNEWRAATAWPPPSVRTMSLYLHAGHELSLTAPGEESSADRYVYDPSDPTPTVGGSIVSYVYPPGSVDVAHVQERTDVLVYTSTPLDHDLDVVGPMRLVLYASSTAVDTDFAARLSDVFPDGRAIQLQNGILRTRFRHIREPAWLVPEEVYRFEIDMWATANRFRQGHRVRIDISSADFPRFDRNSNRGGMAGEPVRATQTIYHDAKRPSHVVLSVLNH